MAVVETSNVFDDLKATASAANVDIENVDVEVLAINASYKIGSDEVKKTQDLSIFNDDALFGNPELAIKEDFKVQFSEKDAAAVRNMPRISIGTNKAITKIVAKIFADNAINYTDDFAQNLINEINKKLLRYGILIGIRNETMLKGVNKVASSLRINGTLENDFTFDVAVGIDPVPSVDDELIYHYKIKNHKEDEKAAFIQAVSAGETIIEYRKPKQGRAGRNLRGEVIKVAEAKTANHKEIQIGENIDKVEDEDGVKYIAKISGYVAEEGDKYDVKEELDLNEISLKSTGSINAGLDSDVTINVKESDALKDAIGAGMVVETSTLNVEGNIAQSAKVRAKTVTIGGQTHAKSYVEADNATIATHLGTLKCVEGNIKRIEGGEVIGKIVNVDSVVGGKIIAEEVHINNLFSNSTIIAAKLIEISSVKGTGNKLVIDVREIPDYKVKFETYFDEMKNLEKTTKIMMRELEDKRAVIDSNAESVASIKERIEELYSKNQEPPVTFLAKLKDYQTLVHEYNSLVKEFRSKKDRLLFLSKNLKEMQNVIFEAKIICRSRWKELNEIRFKLLEPKRDVIYSTRENEFSRVLTLKKIETSGEDIYQINKTNELI